MQIATATAGDHARFRELVNAEIRPDRAISNAWDDFPLILDAENRDWTLVAKDGDGRLLGGLAALIRDHATSLGTVAIAGIGSVVTIPDARGRGVSAALQIEMLERLRRQDVPLAVLWTDQPAIYAGRGFTAAGWEFHIALAGVRWPGPPADLRVRRFEVQDAPAVAALFNGHRWRTLRRAGDDARLYGMPGTSGLVAADADGALRAAVFLGKGADFPGYVHEWSGVPADVTALLAASGAEAVLVPAGGEDLLVALAEQGASWSTLPSGHWCVLRPDILASAAAAAGASAPARPADPVAWLGRPATDGAGPVAGPLSVAIWGFDSV